jgi:hypothetical protein
MLDQKIIQIKNRIFLKAIAYVIIILILHSLNIYLTKVNVKYNSIVEDSKIYLNNIDYKINILYTSQKEFIKVHDLFPILKKNQLFEFCLDKYNIFNKINDVVKNNEMIISQVNNNIFQDFLHPHYQSFNNCNIRNINSIIEFNLMSLKDINYNLQNILNNMPENTYLLSLNVNNMNSINPEMINEFLAERKQNFFKVKLELQFNKILIK